MIDNGALFFISMLLLTVISCKHEDEVKKVNHLGNVYHEKYKYDDEGDIKEFKVIEFNGKEEDSGRVMTRIIYDSLDQGIIIWIAVKLFINFGITMIQFL